MKPLNGLLTKIAWIAIPVCILLVYLLVSKPSPEPESKSEVTNHLVLEKIESIGKLELCKFYIKDVIEQKEIKKEWYLPNSKIVLIISGEVTGCIDLKKIDSLAITILPNKIRIKLPAPEICYSKVNHQESKVYDIENEFFDKAKLIDKAYAMAEKNIQEAAVKMNILDQTKKNAQITLKPLLESFAGKPVELYY